MSEKKRGEGKKSWNAQELAKEMGIDPLKLLLEFAANTSKDDRDRIRAASEACKYIYPTQKAVEIVGDPPPFKVIIEDYKK